VVVAIGMYSLAFLNMEDADFYLERKNNLHLAEAPLVVVAQVVAGKTFF
jgi:hypothetical protein